MKNIRPRQPASSTLLPAQREVFARYLRERIADHDKRLAAITRADRIAQEKYADDFFAKSLIRLVTDIKKAWVAVGREIVAMKLAKQEAALRNAASGPQQVHGRQQSRPVRHAVTF